MIHGAHVILYSRDADADRAFFREVLGFPSVDAGRGWLIFALPPAELAVHPAEAEAGEQGAAEGAAELYLMCSDLDAEIANLRGKGVACSPPNRAPWGTSVTLELPSGGRLGLYEPAHPTALGLGAAKNPG